MSGGIELRCRLPLPDFVLEAELSLPGRGVTALFGPSGELEWGPWGVPHRVVASEAHSCRPCGLDGCGGSKVSDCLVQLPVERVHAAVQALLSREAS